MSSVPKVRLTPAEYLARERQATTKSEYYAGEVFAMAGARRRHNVIVSNTIGELRDHLRTGPCEVYPSDMRVKVSRTGLYTYPDVVVACEPRFEDDREDTLVNPRVLVEVASESTEAYDRGKKSAQYRRIESLQDYLIIDQQEPRVDRLSRQPDGSWSITDAAGLDASIDVPSLGIALPLAEIYARIDFSQPEGDDEAARDSL